MKIKKTSLVALFVAIGMITGVTATFATSAQAAAAEAPEGTASAAPPVGSQQNNPAKATTEIQHCYSYVDRYDGKTYYTTDGGKTWQEGDLFAETGYSYNDIDWWTAEEYEIWMEEQKAELQSIIGERGWNPTEGWYTWDRARVDAAIAGNEQLLEEIKNGKMVSKPMADGDTMIQFGYDPAFQMTTTDTTTAIGSVAMMDSITDNTVMPGSGQTLTAELLEAYKAYGITYDKARGAFYFDGKPVRYFFDGYTLENGVATIYDHVNKDGVVDVHTVRQATQNADGSTNPGGKLVGIEEYSHEEFGCRLIMTPAMAEETASVGFVGSTGGTTFEERFARYKDFGITYAEANGVSGRGNVYLNGQLVSCFSDVAPAGSAFSFTSSGKGGIAVRTVYDSNGQLSGVEIVRE